MPGTTSAFVRHVSTDKFKKLKMWAAQNDMYLYEAVNLAFERVVTEPPKARVRKTKK